jgi:hypothetical protein
MKRSSSAADNSPADSSAYRRPPRRRTHYELTHRRAAADTCSPPPLALHYPVATSHIATDFLSLQHAIGLLASQESGFPTTFLPSTVLLIIDMGASITITPDRADFLTPITPVQPTTLSGIAANLQVQGIGTVTYQFPLPNGTTTSVTLKNVLYVPGCAVRLLCPRHLAESTIIEGDGFLSLQHGGILTCNGIELPVSYDRNTGLPIIYTIGQPALMSSSTLQNPCAANAISNPAPVTPYPSVTQIKPNLSKSQHLKLLMHERCNHRNMADVSQWIRQGLLPVHPSVANCPDPICLACQHGKARRKAHNKSTGGITGASHAPGDGVSADQLEAG